MDAAVLVYTVQHHRYVTLSYLLYDLEVSNRPAFRRCLMLLQQFDASSMATGVLLQSYHEGLWSSSGHVAVCTIVLLALRPLNKGKHMYRLCLVACRKGYTNTLSKRSAAGTCLPAVVFEAFGGLVPGADLADSCTETGSDLDGDIDLGCCCAMLLKQSCMVVHAAYDFSGTNQGGQIRRLMLRRRYAIMLCQICLPTTIPIDTCRISLNL